MGRSASPRELAPSGAHRRRGDGQSAAAYPHLLCGHFIFSRDEGVARARSSNELSTALQSLSTDRKLVGDFQGSWNLPALYIDAYADAVGTENLASAIPPQGSPPNPAALSGLKSVENVCRASCDACLDNTYHEAPNLAADRFAWERAGALIGYSERLHHVLRSRSDKAPLFMASVPFGPTSRPILFVDALVVSKNCKESCAKDARAFADFLTRDDVLRFVLMSEDTDAEVRRIPRYLLPATLSVFRVPAVAADPYYPHLERIISDASPFPTGGLYSRREDLKKQLTEALEATTPQ
jgi:thiamine pyridinylase